MATINLSPDQQIKLRDALTDVLLGQLPREETLSEGNCPRLSSMTIGNLIRPKYDNGKTTPLKVRNTLVITATTLLSVAAVGLVVTAFVITTLILPLLLGALVAGLGAFLMHTLINRNVDLDSKSDRKRLANLFTDHVFNHYASNGFVNYGDSDSFISYEKVKSYALLGKNSANYAVFEQLRDTLRSSSLTDQVNVAVQADKDFHRDQNLSISGNLVIEVANKIFRDFVSSGQLPPAFVAEEAEEVG